MSKLVAQQRLNSNGNVVTRWVSSDNGAEELLSEPVIEAPRPPLDEQVSHVSKVLRKVRTKPHDDTTFFARAHPDTVAFLFDYLADFDLESDYFWELDDDHVLDIANAVEDNFDEETILAYLALYDVHDDRLDDGEAIKYVQGLHVHGRNHAPIDVTSSESVNRNAALLRFMLDLTDIDEFEGRIVYDYSAKAYVLASLGLSHTIYGNPDRYDEIKEYALANYDLVKDRDQSGIEMLLESAGEMTPLEEGRL